MEFIENNIRSESLQRIKVIKATAFSNLIIEDRVDVKHIIRLLCFQQNFKTKIKGSIMKSVKLPLR